MIKSNDKPAPRTSHRKRAFLAAYRETGTVTAAARAVDIDRRQHYRWLERDAKYAAAFQSASEEAADNLEAEARERAIRGLRRYKFHQGIPVMIACEEGHPEAVEVETEQGTRWQRHYFEDVRSDVLLIFLLKGARPEQYAEHKKLDVRQPGDDVRVLEDNDWYGNADTLRARQQETL